MTEVSEIMENEEDIGKPSPVGRVPDTLKDGSSTGPPRLFRHQSMQKIRHCCQNLNLFPYLLYSFGNSKSHPVARKVHLRLGQFLEIIIARMFFLYNSHQHSMLHGIRPAELETQDLVNFGKSKSLAKFQAASQQKPKQSNPFFLILAVYFAPLLLALQLIGLCSLMMCGKYTPGFIFLIASLFFLACISLKILFHQSDNHTGKNEKVKVQ